MLSEIINSEAGGWGKRNNNLQRHTTDSQCLTRTFIEWVFCDGWNLHCEEGATTAVGLGCGEVAVCSREEDHVDHAPRQVGRLHFGRLCLTLCRIVVHKHTLDRVLWTTLLVLFCGGSLCQLSASQLPIIITFIKLLRVWQKFELHTKYYLRAAQWTQVKKL